MVRPDGTKVTDLQAKSGEAAPLSSEEGISAENLLGEEGVGVSRQGYE